MTDKDLILKLGGIGEVAAYTGAHRSAVSNWCLAGRSIPWKHRPVLARMAAEKAVSLPPDYWGVAS